MSCKSHQNTKQNDRIVEHSLTEHICVWSPKLNHECSERAFSRSFTHSTLSFRYRLLQTVKSGMIYMFFSCINLLIYLLNGFVYKM